MVEVAPHERPAELSRDGADDRRVDTRVSPLFGEGAAGVAWIDRITCREPRGNEREIHDHAADGHPSASERARRARVSANDEIFLPFVEARCGRSDRPRAHADRRDRETHDREVEPAREVLGRGARRDRVAVACLAPCRSPIERERVEGAALDRARGTARTDERPRFDAGADAAVTRSQDQRGRDEGAAAIRDVPSSPDLERNRVRRGHRGTLRGAGWTGEGLLDHRDVITASIARHDEKHGPTKQASHGHLRPLKRHRRRHGADLILTPQGQGIPGEAAG